LDEFGTPALLGSQTFKVTAEFDQILEDNIVLDVVEIGFIHGSEPKPITNGTTLIIDGKTVQAFGPPLVNDGWSVVSARVIAG
jgi:hypothetical protein